MENRTDNCMKLPMREKIGYFFGDFGSQFCWTFLGTYLSVFYTDVVGLAPVAVTVIFLVARIWDAVNDPMMGAIAERSHSRWGRFRPWMAFGAPFLLLFAILVFTTPNLSMGGKFAWAMLTYIGAGMLYTLVNIPYGALGTVMTSDIHERTSLNAFRMGGMTIGMLIVNAVSMPLVYRFSGGGTNVSAGGYLKTAALFAVIGFICFYITFFNTKERIEPVTKDKIPVRKAVGAVFSNKYLVICLLIQFFTMLGMMGRIGVAVYYYLYVVEAPQLIALLMTLPAAAGIIGILAAPKLAAVFGKKRTVVVFNLIQSFILFVIFFIPPHNLTLLIAATFLFGMTGVASPIILSLLADAVDYSEYHTGIRPDGIAYATNGLASKAGSALSGISVTVMGVFGYVANAQQTAQAKLGINIVTNIIPAVCFLLAGLVTLLWNLNESESAEIRKKLDNGETLRAEAQPVSVSSAEAVQS
jgi:sugar (glycoside-pentoside-hexuronide) transporter